MSSYVKPDLRYRNEKQNLGSPDRPKKSAHKVRKPQPTSANYLNKEVVAPGQEYDEDKIKAARVILDENISLLSKDCYLRLKQQVV